MKATIINRRNNKIIFSQALEAKSFFLKLKGLMFKKTMPEDEALVFYRTSSIHTCFMKFPIDVIFLDANKKIIKIVENIYPWRMAYCKGAYYTIEAKAKNPFLKDIKVGDALEFIHENNL